MGLFGSTKIFVASTVQNLAGPEAERSNYLKTAVVGSVLSGEQSSIGSDLSKSYLYGPGMKLRNFYRWAQTHYDSVGMPSGNQVAVANITAAEVEPFYGLDPGITPTTQKIETGLGDFAFWSEKWVMENYPERLDTDWTSDINQLTDEITITWDDLTTSSFTPSGFDRDGYYIYTTFVTDEKNITLPMTTGPTITLDDGDPWPDTTGWTSVSSSSIPTDVDLVETVEILMEYSDATPDDYSSSDTPSTDSYDEYHEEFTKTVYNGVIGSENQIESTYYEMFFDQTYEIITTVDVDVVVEDIGGGVTRTTTTTTTTESIGLVRTHRTDNQVTVDKKWAGPFMFIYGIGTGNTDLDDLITDAGSMGGEYFPLVPIRIDGVFLGEGDYTGDVYDQSKIALKRSVGGRLDKIISELEDADNLEDMDYVYAVFGVTANTQEQTALQYLFQFLGNLYLSQVVDVADYAAWQTEKSTYDYQLAEWSGWRADQETVLGATFGGLEPDIDGYTNLARNSFRVKSSTSLPTNFDMEVNWQAIEPASGSGLAKPDAEAGEVWFDLNPTDIYDEVVTNGKTNYNVKDTLVEKIRIYHQIDESSWEAYDLYGFTHKNYIYAGKFVEISLKEALEDSDTSGFIFPLHFPTFQSMTMVDRTQMATACCYLVVNSYLVKKTGILGSLFFKIFLVALMIIVVVAFPALAPAVASAAATTGAALGLTGIAALIAGVIVNSLVATIITRILTEASIAVLGRKFGSIFAAVAMVAAVVAAGNYANTGSFSLDINSFMDAGNLMSLTSSVGNAYANVLAMKTQDIYTQTAEMMKAYDSQMLDLTKRYAQEFGYDNGLIDPMMFVGQDIQESVLGETSEAFLTRTLMTGSDIAGLSMDLLYNFSELTLITEMP